MGQKTVLICRRHSGLATMLPLASDGIFGVTYMDMVAYTLATERNRDQHPTH